MPFLSSLRDPYFIYRYRQLIHVIRSVVALAILFILLHGAGIPHGSWALVSALMVMGSLPHIGGVVLKGLQRLLGTILGALYGFILLILPTHSMWITDALTLLAIGIALYATFTSRFGYSALMFGITILMVVGDGDLDISAGIWRSINVIFGTTMAIVVTLFVLPQKATDVLRFLLADNIDKLNHLYRTHITDTPLDAEAQFEVMKTVTAQLVKQRALIDAVHQEGRIRRGSLVDILSIERRMIATVELLLETHKDSPEGHTLIARLKGLKQEQLQLSQSLGELAHQIRTGQMIDIRVDRFSLQRYAPHALTTKGNDNRWLFSPGGYLWLNRDLARQTTALANILKNIQRLPSSRLQRIARHEHMITDKRPDQGGSD